MYTNSIQKSLVRWYQKPTKVSKFCRMTLATKRNPRWLTIHFWISATTKVFGSENKIDFLTGVLEAIKSPKGIGKTIMTRYSKDPRQISAKFSSNCCKCKTRIPKGTTIYYWPASSEVFCSSCGDAPFRGFLSSVADEEVYAGSGNPYAY